MLFTAAWAHDCLQISPLFHALSCEFDTGSESESDGRYLQFATMDIGRYGGIANKYDISLKSTTKQLPSMILFKHGKEIERMPKQRDDGSFKKEPFNRVCCSTLCVKCQMSNVQCQYSVIL